MRYEPAKKLYTIKDLHWSFKETPCKQQWTAETLDVTYFVSRKRKSSKKEWLHWGCSCVRWEKVNGRYVGVTQSLGVMWHDVECAKMVCQNLLEIGLMRNLDEFDSSSKSGNVSTGHLSDLLKEHSTDMLGALEELVDSVESKADKNGVVPDLKHSLKVARMVLDRINVSR